MNHVHPSSKQPPIKSLQTIHWMNKDNLTYFGLGLVTGVFILKYFLNAPQPIPIESKNEEKSNENPTTATKSVEKTLPILVREEIKMVLVVRTDLKMGTGKIAAQCSHATLGVYMKMMKNKDPTQLAWLKKWIDVGQAKITLKTDSLNSL
jgi:hypothetical protein